MWGADAEEMRKPTDKMLGARGEGKRTPVLGKGKNLVIPAVSGELLQNRKKSWRRASQCPFFHQRTGRQILGEGEPLGENYGVRISGIRSTDRKNSMGSAFMAPRPETAWGVRGSGVWQCPSFQTDLPSPQRDVCFTSLSCFSSIFTWCLRPDTSTNSFHWKIREIFKRGKKDRIKEKTSRTLYERDHVCRSADSAWKMIPWKRPLASNSWAAVKWFLGRGLWRQIVELLPVFYDSFIISPPMRQIKTNLHSFPSVWGLLLTFVSCCFAEALGFEKTHLAASSLFVAALVEMGCHLGAMAAETQQTKAITGFHGWSPP